jgi:hypothetical protein
MSMREFYEKRGKAFYTRYYKQLEGAKITRFYGIVGDGYGDGFPTFEIELPNCQIIKIEISQDPEGNGGGFIFGLNQPDMSDWDKRGAALQKIEEALNA